MSLSEKHPEFFDLLNEYFRAGKKSDILKEDIRKFVHIHYDGKYAEFQHDFFSQPIWEDHKVDMLLNLGVHPSQWQLFLGRNNAHLSLHCFLNRLSKEGMGPQFPWLLDYIEWKKIKRISQYILPFLPIVPIPLALYANELFDFMMQSINYLPILGIVGAVGVFIVSYYFNDSNLRVSDKKLKIEKYFLLASHALAITGKFLLVFATDLLVSMSQYLFLASALVNVISKFVHFRELYKQKITIEDCSQDSQIVQYQKIARLTAERTKQRNELIISFISALIVAGLTLLCTVTSLSSSMTMGIAALTFIITGLELLGLKANEKYMANALHKDLADINKFTVPIEERKALLVNTNDEIKEDTELSPRTKVHLEHMLSVAQIPQNEHQSRGALTNLWDPVVNELNSKQRGPKSPVPVEVSEKAQNEAIDHMLIKYGQIESKVEPESARLVRSQTKSEISLTENSRRNYAQQLRFYQTTYLKKTPQNPIPIVAP